MRTDEQWRGLALAISEDWARDERFTSVVDRLRHRHAIENHLANWTRQRSSSDITSSLQAAGVPVGQVYNIDGPPNDPHLQSVGYYRQVPHALIGPYRRPGPLWRMSETPVEFRLPTNLLGEHNREVFCDILGLNEEEYRALQDQGITGTEYKPGADLDPEDRT